MKKWCVLLVMALFLSGCAAVPTFETVTDVIVTEDPAQPREVTLELPDDASTLTMENEQGTLYLCDDYEITVQTVWGTDINATIRNATGYEPEDLTVIQTRENGYTRYELVWATTGETGERIGRCTVLDDGNYHYVLTVMAQPQQTGMMQDAWNELFSSFALV